MILKQNKSNKWCALVNCRQADWVILKTLHNLNIYVSQKKFEFTDYPFPVDIFYKDELVVLKHLMQL
jgi:hypothetical protein